MCVVDSLLGELDAALEAGAEDALAPAARQDLSLHHVLVSL